MSGPKGMNWFNCSSFWQLRGSFLFWEQPISDTELGKLHSKSCSSVKTFAQVCRWAFATKALDLILLCGNANKFHLVHRSAMFYSFRTTHGMHYYMLPSAFLTVATMLMQRWKREIKQATSGCDPTKRSHWHDQGALHQRLAHVCT